MGILKELEICRTLAAAVQKEITIDSEPLTYFMVGYALRIKMILPVYFGAGAQKSRQL